MRTLRVGMAIAALALVAPAVAQADDVTPDGPATLDQAESGCVYTAEGSSPAVLTAVDVTVGANSRPGRVRIRYRGEVVSDWFDLPSAAGTYRIATRGVEATYLVKYQRTGLGLEQEAGGHAVLGSAPSYVSGSDATTGLVLGRCERHLDVRAGDATSTLADTRLTLQPIVAPDADGDLVADGQEGTDLAIALTPAPAGRGTTQLVARVVNRGPRVARSTAVGFDAPAPAVFGSVAFACGYDRAFPSPVMRLALPATGRVCSLGDLAPGASVDVPIAVTTDAPVTASARVLAVGDDPTPADAAATAPVLPPAPQLTLLGPSRARIGAPVRLRLRSDRTGSFALSATVALPGGRTVRLPGRTVALAKDVRRVVALRPTAAQARSLRRAGRRTLRATVTLSGDDAASGTLTVALRP